MIRSLVAKEWRQHWPAFLALAMLGGVGFALVTAASLRRGDLGSLFESLRAWVAMVSALAALVLGNRLVVVEYQARTQLFLAALPLSAFRMILVKYVLGMALLCLLLAGALGISAALAGARESVTPRFLGILAARAGAFSWFVYSFFFAMGFLGRYRLALYLALAIALIGVDSLTEWELGRFAPFELINERFAYQTEAFPIEALAWTSAFSLILMTMAFAMGGARAGSVASLLSEKMSHREKVFIAALLAGVIFAVSLLAEQAEKTPFDLVDATVAEVGEVTVKVGAERSDAETRAWAQALAEELDRAREYLGLETWPPIFITERIDLDGRHYELGRLEANEGVHVRVHRSGAGWSDRDFLAWLIREALVARSRGRVEYEPNRWVLDGFPWFWLAGKSREAVSIDERLLELRAVHAAPSAIGRGTLEDWLEFRERAGDELASATAWLGLTAVQRRAGDGACRAWLASVLGASVPRDFRGLIHERRNPLPRLLSLHAGFSLEELLEDWNVELDALRKRLEDDLARIPTIAGEARFDPISAETRAMRYQASIHPPPADGALWTFLYAKLPPFDEEIPPEAIRREIQPYAPDVAHQIPETFARGARVAYTFALRSEFLECRLISGWVRTEIP